MKINLLRMLGRAALVVCTVFALNACGDDEPDSPDVDPDDPSQVDPDPDDPTTVDPDTPVPDPAGTVIVNIANNDEEVLLYDAPTDYADLKVSIDGANNFSAGKNCKIVSVGKVAGLGNITEIPAAGWKEKTAVSPGEGYVIKLEDVVYNYVDGHGITTNYTFYGRIYVVEYMESVGGGIMGARVKYQAPFQMPIRLSSKNVTFTASGDGLVRTVTLLNPTSVNIDSKPEWVDVQVNDLEITLTAQENFTATARTGEIVLSNDEGTATIKVSQSVSSNPLFAGGSGTAEDPYQVSTAKQLDNVRKAPGAHFIQTADISLSSYIEADGNGWLPIGGHGSDAFTGTYDGGMHKISGLWINRPATDAVGLFGEVSDATITGIRLSLAEAAVKGNNYVGGIAGKAFGNSGTTVSQCSVEGSIRGNHYVSGIVSSEDGGNYKWIPYAVVSQCKFEGRSSSFGIGFRCTVDNSYVIGDCYYAFGYSSLNCYIIGDYSYLAYNNGSSFCYGWKDADNAEKSKKQSTFEGWDFANIWQIREGVSAPTLRCFSR